MTDVSIQVVASTQSREFLLATLDHKIAGAKASLDLHRANADQAVADGTPIMEQHALACAQANSDALDWLLERRFRLSSEAL